MSSRVEDWIYKQDYSPMKASVGVYIFVGGNCNMGELDGRMFLY